MDGGQLRGRSQQMGSSSPFVFFWWVLLLFNERPRRHWSSFVDQPNGRVILTSAHSKITSQSDLKASLSLSLSLFVLFRSFSSPLRFITSTPLSGVDLRALCSIDRVESRSFSYRIILEAYAERKKERRRINLHPFQSIESFPI